MAAALDVLQKLAPLLIFLAAALGLAQSIMNGRATRNVASAVERVEKQTNGLTAALVDVTKKDSHAAGMSVGHAEGLEQGREEGRAVAAAVDVERSKGP